MLKAPRLFPSTDPEHCKDQEDEEETAQEN